MGSKYRAFSQKNFNNIKQLDKLPPDILLKMEAVSRVLPFRTNNYVTDKLINWDNIPEDPMFRMTFPQPEMLKDEDLERIMYLQEKDPGLLNEAVNRIRMEMNPHPAGQLELNIPMEDGVRLNGIQHKYRETILFFPEQGQTCHAYCTYCFRWAQFIGIDDLKMASDRTEILVKYLSGHPEVTDLLLTGGDPMFMRTKLVRRYLEDIIRLKPGGLKNIRIGTKALSYWPYRFTEDEDAADLLNLFRQIVDSGFHLTVMAHFTHPVEMKTPEAEEAVEKILETGAVIRCQSPVLKHINDDENLWVDMWENQVRMGMIPYYMFVPRDTGPKDYFNLPLERMFEIFSGAYSRVSGLSRTVRGPSMSAKPGKVLVEGIVERDSRKYFALKYIQARDPGMVNRIFFADFDPDAGWITDLKPASEEDRKYFP